MFSGLPDTYFAHDGVGLGMVSPGEPRLRPWRRHSDEPGLLRTALARLAEAVRVPAPARTATSS